MIEFCSANDLKVTNTMFRKPLHKIATYRKRKETDGITNEDVCQETHEQIDHTLTTRRWKNTVKDAESDTKANIDSDHYPVTNTIQTKLTAQKKTGEGRNRYMKCSTAQNAETNKTLTEHTPHTKTKHFYEKMLSFCCRGVHNQEGQNCTQSVQIATQTDPNDAQGAPKAGPKDRRASDIKEWLKKGIDMLPKEPKKDKYKKHKLSEKSKELIEQRGQARKHRNIQEFTRLTKEFRKSRKEDKRQHILTTIGRDLDIRDRWLGIRELKSKYNPIPYHNKNEEGKHLAWTQRAQKASEYLSNQQWGEPSNEDERKREEFQHTYRNNKFIEYHPLERYNTAPPSMEELERVIKKLKRRKAPGPDDIPTEIVKELDADNKEYILELMVKWWNEEYIEEEELQARVVLIYKKGDTNKFENYRPISLLNTLYKIFAALLHIRISETLDRHLQKTQFGFRKKKSTADAIHLIRRIIEYGESTTNQLHLVLLDWEKAFDKVVRSEMFNAMTRMGVHTKLITLVKQLYKSTTFKVEIDGHSSDWQTQHTGIRQGCPLSPYLFLIVMTTMFEDIHSSIDSVLEKHRSPGADFDEVTYADDTICFSTDTKAINLFIKAIEEEGFRYGLKLNKQKCELITTHQQANIHFKDNTKVPKVRLATYLGCNIGIKTNNREELSKRFANTMITMKKLDLFWRHSSCDTAIKIYTAEAVLRSKLLYGLESAQLIPSVAKRLETFQLKVLRKILKIDTTYVDRANTNQLVFNTANQKMAEERKQRTVLSFIDVYRKLKMKAACKIISNNQSNIHKVTFQGETLEKWIHQNRRVGKPRMSWAETTINEIWEILKQSNERYRYTAFDHTNPQKVDTLKQFAREYIQQ